MTATYLVAIDLGKRHFQVCVTDCSGKTLFNRAFSRQKLKELPAGQSRCIVAMEACSTSHYWGRVAQGAGREVRLIPSVYVKPFVKRQKNDAADAEDCGLPPVVREMAGFYLDQIKALTLKIAELVRRLLSACRTDDFLRRLCTIPGGGPVTAGALAAFAVGVLAREAQRQSGGSVVVASDTTWPEPP